MSVISILGKLEKLKKSQNLAAIFCIVSNLLIKYGGPTQVMHIQVLGYPYSNNSHISQYLGNCADSYK